jgi:hypothetical protein
MTGVQRGHSEVRIACVPSRQLRTADRLIPVALLTAEML